MAQQHLGYYASLHSAVMSGLVLHVGADITPKALQKTVKTVCDKVKFSINSLDIFLIIGLRFVIFV